MALSFATVSPGLAQEYHPIGRTLPRLLETLCLYRAAGESRDIQERLRLQRELADALDAATVVLRHDPSAAADDARTAVATIRSGLGANAASLDRGASMLESVLEGTRLPQISAALVPHDADTTSLFETMAWDVNAFRDAVANGDANLALSAQAELLNGANLVELTLRYVPTTTAQRVRSALDDLRAGFAGDANCLNAAACAFGALAQQAASI